MLDIIIIIFWSLCCPLAVLFTYFSYKRRKSAGREILTGAAVCGGGLQTFSQHFTVTAAKKWHRIQCMFLLQGFEHVQAQDLHPYTLKIVDENLREVFRERRNLSDFFIFCWHPGSRPGTAEHPACPCDPVLLEFIPPAPGGYTLEFSLKAQEEHSLVKECVLNLREGVWVLKTKPYVHTWIDLRKHNTGREHCPTGKKQPQETSP